MHVSPLPPRIIQPDKHCISGLQNQRTISFLDYKRFDLGMDVKTAQMNDLFNSASNVNLLATQILRLTPFPNAPSLFRSMFNSLEHLRSVGTGWHLSLKRNHPSHTSRAANYIPCALFHPLMNADDSDDSDLSGPLPVR